MELFSNRFFSACFAIMLISLTGCQLFKTPQATNTTSPNTNVGGTNKPAAITYWLDYNLKQCETAPWGTTLEPDTISAYYADAFNMEIYAIEVVPPPAGFFSCAACGCPTGTVVSIQTDASGRGFLLDEGFTEADADISASAQTPDAAIQAEANVNDIAVVDVTTLTPEDALLRQAAERIEIALADYYSAHGSYPETLQSLNLEVDTAAFTYTPIGSLPADYYDLVIYYSTGAVTVNP